MDTEEFLVVLGMILLFVFTAMRVFAENTKAAWGYTFLYFSVLMGLFTGCFSGTVPEALGVAVPGALVIHFIAFLRSCSRRTNEKSTGKTPPQKPAPPVEKPKPAQQKPVTTPKPAQQKSAEKTKPAAPASQVPKPAPKPAVQKPAEVRQTLTSCMRCGKRLQAALCGYCGCNHAAGQLRLLCRVDPRKLQMKKHKRSGKGGTP